MAEAILVAKRLKASYTLLICSIPLDKVAVFELMREVPNTKKRMTSSHNKKN